MTVKQTLKLVFGGIIAFLLALLGIQRKVIKNQKEDIKEKEAEIVTKEAQVEASQDLMEIKEELSVKEEAQKEKIQEADNEQEALEEINVILRDFNKRSRN